MSRPRQPHHARRLRALLIALSTLSLLTLSACGEEPAKRPPILILDDSEGDMASGDMAPEDMAPDMTPEDMGPPTPAGVAYDTIAWSSGPALMTARDHHMTFLHTTSDGSALFVAGGIEAGQPSFLEDVWFAKLNEDGTLGAWTATEPLPIKLAGAPVIQTPGGRVILPSGRTTEGGRIAFSDAVFTTAPTLDGVSSWTTSAPMPGKRFHHGGAATDTHLYITGGLELNDATDTVFIGVMDEDGVASWRASAPMPEGRTHHSTFIHDGYLYVVGGFTGSLRAPNYLTSVHRAPILDSGDLGAWEADHATLLAPLATQANLVHEGYVYLLGGLGPAGFEDRVHRAPLGPEGVGAFVELPAAKLPRRIGHTHHTPVLDGRVYMVSGGMRNTLDPTAHVGLFQP